MKLASNPLLNYTTNMSYEIYYLLYWNSYFETILDNLLECDVEKSGILEAYFNLEGWYEESSWLIEDVSLATS